jgi:peptidyl-prolyl cis-trans isomerase-like protein 2
MFITATEWRNEYGGKKTAAGTTYTPLPFTHCALSLSPFHTPVCTKEVRKPRRD